VIHLDKLVTLELLFTCVICKAWTKQKVKLLADLKLDASDFPVGWVIMIDTNYFKSYCPEHTMQAK